MKQPSREEKDLLAYDVFLLFGATVAAKEVMEYLTDRGKRVVGFLDNNPEKHGTSFLGYPVWASDEALAAAHRDAGIIIASAYQCDIAGQLIEEMNVSEERVFPFISDMFHGHFENRHFMESREEMEGLVALIGDDESRDYLQRILAFRWTMNPLYLKPNPNVTGFYEYKGAGTGPFPGDVIVDCGAFIGDTAEVFVQRAGGECSVYAIEALGKNYKAMSEWIDRAGMKEQVTPLHIAVGSEPGEMGITSHEEGSDPRGRRAIGEAGQTQTVIVETLDHLVETGRLPADVQFIKMDIEGAEEDALQGAKRLIERQHSRMAIAAYHVPEHLWRLPALIRGFNPACRICAGHHPSAVYETEFYIGTVEC